MNPSSILTFYIWCSFTVLFTNANNSSSEEADVANTECSCDKVEFPGSASENSGQFCGHELNKLNENDACEEHKLFECSKAKNKLTINEEVTFTDTDDSSCLGEEKCGIDPEEATNRICLHPKGIDYSRIKCQCPKTLPGDGPDQITETDPNAEFVFDKDEKMSFQICGKELNKLNSNHACGKNDMILCGVHFELGISKTSQTECKKCSPHTKHKKKIRFWRVCKDKE